MAKRQTFLTKHKYPVEQEAGSGKQGAGSQGEGWCAIHNTAMRQTTKNGRTWVSHRTDQGWCQGKGVRS